jgi:hypothetical protein
MDQKNTLWHSRTRQMTGSVNNSTGKDAQYIYRPVGPTSLWVTVRNHNGLVMQGKYQTENYLVRLSALSCI